MKDNEIYYEIIFDKIKKSFENRPEGFTIQTLLYEKSLLDNVSESNIREFVNWGIRNGIIISKNIDGVREPTLFLSKNSIFHKSDEHVTISVSAPTLSDYSIGKVIERNGFLTTESAFTKLILSARNIIRISSPFLQRNVASEKGIPNLEKIILLAYQHGCKFVILSREVYTKRKSDLTWLINLSKENGFAEKLEIFDYHKSKSSNTVESSTHAKLIISDDKEAYIGSAELRMNSIYKNFEVGVLLEGPAITGLIELFDSMTTIAKRVY